MRLGISQDVGLCDSQEQLLPAQPPPLNIFRIISSPLGDFVLLIPDVPSPFHDQFWFLEFGQKTYMEVAELSDQPAGKSEKYSEKCKAVAGKICEKILATQTKNDVSGVFLCHHVRPS